MGNETYQYDPYGQLIHTPRTAALQTNAWRYASGYDAVSTELYKFGIRYYEATIGRWTQRDPVGGSLLETTKANPYVYADDDPVNEVDLSGQLTCIQARAALVLAASGAVLGTFFSITTLGLALAAGLGGIAALIYAADAVVILISVD